MLEEDGTVEELAMFSGDAEVSCLSLTDAEQLGADIRGSLTIKGDVVPRWTTAVICGFVEDTSAVCWQFSPEDGQFLEVGGWIT